MAAREEINIVQIVFYNGALLLCGPPLAATRHTRLQTMENRPTSDPSWAHGRTPRAFPHTPWLDLSAYFARALKVDVYSSIGRDGTLMWARTPLRDAEATDDGCCDRIDDN